MVGAIGSFVNHVRWLMLLDPSFKIVVPAFDEVKYNVIKGADWPSYDSYLKKDLSKVDEFIKQEFVEKEAYLIDLTGNIDSKVQEFESKIYPESRTWHNWLLFEWRYRERLDQLINVTHDLVKPTDMTSKNLLLNIDPELSYRSYLKFNTLLNNETMDSFKKMVSDNNRKFMESVDNGSSQVQKILDSTVLFQPVLDKNFYDELTQWFDLNDCYEQANYVHSLWYKAHKRAEKEFVTDIREFYEN